MIHLLFLSCVCYEGYKGFFFIIGFFLDSTLYKKGFWVFILHTSHNNMPVQLLFIPNLLVYSLQQQEKSECNTSRNLSYMNITIIRKSG